MKFQYKGRTVEITKTFAYCDVVIDRRVYRVVGTIEKAESKVKELIDGINQNGIYKMPWHISTGHKQ